MKKGYLIAACVGQNFQNYTKSIKFFKKYRDVCEEDNDLAQKLYAYSEMGKSYQYMKEYRNAIKSFKKVLEIAW
jgi:tetratricopeptide (TPR) repeat protein